MGDLSNLSDRDLLVRIITKLESLEDIPGRVRQLELAQAGQRGFLDGAKALWALIAATPAVIGFWLGNR